MNDDEPASPCTGLCQLDPQTGWCLGCYRTLDEIARWSVSSVAEKLAVLDKLAARRRTTETP